MRKVTTTPMRRVQSSLTEAHWTALSREAKARGLSLSQVASEAMARGLRRSPQADPDDRLLSLERRLSDHMRLTARDLQIIEELQFALARLMFLRLPETELDHDPLNTAAVDRRLKTLLDEVASRIAAGPPPSRTLDETVPVLAPLPAASSAPPTASIVVAL